MLFICYDRCSTCKKAENFLLARGHEFAKRDIKGEKPALEELRAWHERSGLPLKRFFNTSGNAYKLLNLKEKLPRMSAEEQLELLATDGMLVKRPILVLDDAVLVGFKQQEWEARGL